jgi:signal transduction histidine kinase/ActR/RegA family two-component response regulator
MDWTVLRSLRGKFMGVALGSALAALAVAAIALVVYDLRGYRSRATADLATQADIVGSVSAAAVIFSDEKAASEYLNAFQRRPRVLAAALYRSDGSVLARYRGANGRPQDIPDAAEPPGSRLDDRAVSVTRRIVHGRETVGYMYVAEEFDLQRRLRDTLGILALALAAGAAAALALSAWLQGKVLAPVLSVTAVARQVVQGRDFSLRAQRTSSDEIGVLVDAFNDMLSELGRRSAELQEAVAALRQQTGEREAAQRALQLADRRKDEFIATLAHELRNPLAPLRNAVGILKLSDEPTAARRARDIMERQIAQMVRLIDDLLDVSRITTGKLVLKRERIALQHPTETAIEAVRPLIQQKAQRLTLALAKEPLWVDADATRITQVVSNVLHNASKYTDAGGSIWLTLASCEDRAEIAITDDGIGIAAEKLDAVFDMFAQVDTSIERSQGGLGVGLALAQRLVRMHGGRLTASSEGPGRGARFTIHLPLQAPAGSMPADDEEKAGGAALQAGRRILIVDDNADFAASMATLLGLQGHRVQVVHDGAGAEPAAASFMPDAVLLDIGLPQLSGYEVARRLQANPLTRHAVLIATTGWGQERDRQQTREAGFKHHLVKPVDPAELTALLDGIRSSQAGGEAGLSGGTPAPPRSAAGLAGRHD